jgi:hypothetical protein
MRLLVALSLRGHDASFSPAQATELKIFPITLGGGKRLFADGTIPAAFKVTESTVTSKGVIIVNYERAGAVPTGSL